MGARSVGGGKEERRRDEELGGWGMICGIYSDFRVNCKGVLSRLVMIFDDDVGRGRTVFSICWTVISASVVCDFGGVSR